MPLSTLMRFSPCKTLVIRRQICYHTEDVKNREPPFVITGIRGLTEAQKATLRALGAIENEADEQSTSSEQATHL